MSDLLSRLIGRARGVVSPVEPILASRYESLVSLEAQTPSESKEGTATWQDAKRVPPAGERNDEVIQAEGAPNAPARRLSPTRPQVERAESTPGGEDRREPRRESTSPFPAAAAPAHLEDLPNLPAAPSSEPSAESPVSEIRAETTEVHATAESRGTRDEPAGAGHIAVSVTRAEDRAAGAAMRQESVQPERSPVQPVEVQVTIGHIEVRAAPVTRLNEDPGRRPRAARPAVSLDDYLRRRNGGAR
ncbi:MAG TPA: hypothetical protein VGV35_18140 [Bryobacteraceae bacterium]|nr:hypothetical protein [Bryobacteraceae bacterium]